MNKNRIRVYLPVARRARHLIILTSLLLGSYSTWGQVYHNASASYGIKLGQTRTLYESGLALPTDAEKIRALKQNKPPFVPNFFGRGPKPIPPPTAKPQGPDPLFDPGALRTPKNMILPSVNFEGLSEQNVFAGVPDVSGEIGQNHYVEVLNQTFFRVYHKNGTPASSIISANTIWNQVGQSSLGDPILLYDQAVDRWLLTEFAPVSARTVLVAISATSDPLGSWIAYKFQTPSFS